MRDVRLPQGRRLRVRSWPGEGRPLVLLHGLLDDSEGWTGLALDTHRPVHRRSTCPGFGGSDLPRCARASAPTPRTSPPASTGSASTTCTLVGHSLGGAVATAVAERHDGVHSLVLLAPAGFGHDPPRRVRSRCPACVDVAQLALPLALVSPLLVTAGYTTFVAHGRLPSRDLTDRLRRRAFQSGAGRAQRRHRDRRRRPLPARLPPARASRSTARSPRSGASATRSCRSSHTEAVRPRCRRPTSRSGRAWATTRSASAPRSCRASSSATRPRRRAQAPATRTRSARRG